MTAEQQRTKLASSQRLLFIGDSITDCGRRTDPDGLGAGYVRLLADLLTIREPQKRVTLLNRGISGDRVTGLRDRWQADAIALQPDWLFVLIGINDLHSYLNDDDQAVSPQLYREAYLDILQQTQQELPDTRLVLLEPFYICRPDQASAWQASVLQLLPEYLKVVRELREPYAEHHVRVHDRFQDLLQHHPAGRFCPEPVHPNATGHLVIADLVCDILQ